MIDRDGHTIATATGRTREHPRSILKRNRYGGYDQDAYPLWTIVDVKGVIEVIEHRRMEPVFFVSDDPTLTKEASAAMTDRAGPLK